MAMVTDGTGKQRGEQVLDLVTGQPDQPGRWRVAGLFSQGRHHEEGVGEHSQGGPAIPGAPAADLVLIQAAQPLGGLEGFLNLPSRLHL